MNDERLAELKEKYKGRNILEELAWGAYADHSGYTSKQNGEFLNWLCMAAYKALKERPQGVAYLCDGDNCPAEKASCKHGGPCRHTTNIEHAINFRRFHDTDAFYEVENVMRIEGQENQ